MELAEAIRFSAVWYGQWARRDQQECTLAVFTVQGTRFGFVGVRIRVLAQFHVAQSMVVKVVGIIQLKLGVVRRL